MNWRPPRAVAEVLLSAVPQLSDRLPEYHLRRAWAALVGPEVARRARPMALANGCLTIQVDNSPWLHELTLRAAELTARLQAEFPTVKSVRLTLGALPDDPATPPERAPRRGGALSAADLREIETAAAAIPDSALSATARRLLTRAWRDGRARGGER